MPGARMVYIPHPVQLLTDDELNARADAIFPDVLAALTGGESEPVAGRDGNGQNQMICVQPNSVADTIVNCSGSAIWSRFPEWSGQPPGGSQYHRRSGLALP